MKMQELKDLASLMQEYELTKIELSPEGAVVMERQPAAVPARQQRPAPDVKEQERQPGAEAEGKILHAPMVGVFYSASDPEAEPFVKPGDHVRQGDVLCIIEAMKLMNEITAEQEGEISEVLVQNGQLVEYGQPLFRLR